MQNEDAEPSFIIIILCLSAPPPQKEQRSQWKLVLFLYINVFIYYIWSVLMK